MALAKTKTSPFFRLLVPYINSPIKNRRNGEELKRRDIHFPTHSPPSNTDRTTSCLGSALPMAVLLRPLGGHELGTKPLHDLGVVSGGF